MRTTTRTNSGSRNRSAVVVSRVRARRQREARARTAGMPTVRGSATSPAQGVVDFLDLLVLPLDGLIDRPLVHDDLGRRVGQYVARLHLGGRRGGGAGPPGRGEPLRGPPERPVVVVLVEVVLRGGPRLVEHRPELPVGVLHDRHRLLRRQQVRDQAHGRLRVLAGLEDPEAHRDGPHAAAVRAGRVRQRHVVGERFFLRLPVLGGGGLGERVLEREGDAGAVGGLGDVLGDEVLVVAGAGPGERVGRLHPVLVDVGRPLHHVLHRGRLDRLVLAVLAGPAPPVGVHQALHDPVAVGGAVPALAQAVEVVLGPVERGGRLLGLVEGGGQLHLRLLEHVAPRVPEGAPPVPRQRVDLVAAPGNRRYVAGCLTTLPLDLAWAGVGVQYW